MAKIIAREVAPDCVDFSFYFDNDGLTNVSGENCACYIIPGDRRRNTGFNMDEYKEIEKRAESILDGFVEVAEKLTDGFKTHKEVMEQFFVPYTSAKCHALKEWAKTADISGSDDIAEFLTITTGENWNVKAFHGYSQGDYCEVLYCTAHYGESHITEIGKFWLGCGTEFIIDDCGGYFITDDLRWKENADLVATLAEYAGCNSEDLEVYLYDGEHSVVDYKLLVA